MKTMKTILCLAGLLLAMNFPASAALFPTGSLGSAAIPDNNTLGTGTSLTYTLSGGDTSLTSLSLAFTLTGGFASDLQGYLRLGNTTSSTAYNLTSFIHSQALGNYMIDLTTTFTAQDPNNTWTLFFADTSAGGATTVTSWSLTGTAVPGVPEPVNVALGAFGAVLLTVVGVRRYVRTNKTV